MPGHFGGSHSHGDKKSNNRTSPSVNRGTSLHGGPKYKAPTPVYSKAKLNPSDDTAAKKNVFISKGASNIDKTFKTPAVAFLSGPLKAGSKKTRGFFYDDVLSSKKAKKNIGYTQDEFEKLSSTKQEEVFKSYMDKRTSGATDAFGNVNPNYGKDDGGSKQPAQPPEPIIVKKNIGGTEVQTTDVKLAEEKKKKEEAEDEYDARRTKRRGRRMTILTSPTGTGGGLVLGKPTLLGA
jgi:hypothetical protein